MGQEAAMIQQEDKEATTADNQGAKHREDLHQEARVMATTRPHVLYLNATYHAW